MIQPVSRYTYLLILGCVVSWFGVWFGVRDVHAQSARAEDPKNTTTVTQKAKKAPKRWYQNFTASVSLTSTLGTGSFAPSNLYQNHYFAQTVDLSLGYTIWKGLSIAAAWGFDWEYTQPDNDAGRRFFARDVGLTLAWNNPIDAIKKHLAHGISVSVSLPASLMSQVETRYLMLGFDLSLGYTFAKIVTLQYGFGISKLFHRYTSPVFNQADATLPSVILRQSTRESLDFIQSLAPIPGTRNVSWQLSNSLSLTVRPHKTVAIGIAFSIAHAFKYPVPVDGLTPLIPTVDGDIQADAVGRADIALGNVFVSWTPIKYIGLTLGAASLQTPWAANNKVLRMPFFNAVTANDNTTTFYLRVTGTY